MISCHRVLVATLLLGILSAPTAWGQISTAPAVGGGAIPPAIKNATIIDAGGETQIKTFVAAQLGQFRQANTDAVPKAREALVAEAKGGSAAYLAKYGEILNAEILNVLGTVKDMKARLNAAIVIARVAEIANNTKLERSVLALLDKAQPEALKLWGMRAARPLLPELIKVNGEKPLIEAVMGTVKQFPDNGPLAEDAYDALNPRNAAAKAIPTVVDALLDLTAWRIDIYKNGLPGQGGKTLLPDLPDADSTPFVNIFNQGVWINLDKAKKQDVRTMQLACELLHWSAVRGEMPAYRNAREQLQGSIARVAGGIFVAASVLQDANVANVAKDVNGRAGQQQVDLVALVHPLCDLIPKMKGFEDVHPPQPSAPPDQQGKTNTTASDGGTNPQGGAAAGGNIPGAAVQQAR
jgi:hypothetical protein